MSKRIAAMVGLAMGAFITPASAYQLDCEKEACTVKCDNGEAIGTMYWNGSKWSDGVRADPDKHVVARMMVAAWGSSCT
jgi:hypothetical protein